MRSPEVHRVILGVTLAVLLGPVQAQERQQEPLETGLVERTEQRLIQLDVSLTPRKERDTGLVIPALGPEDFDLVINARRIPIQHADRVCDEPRGVAEIPAGRERPVGASASPDVPLPKRSTSYIFYIEHTLLTLAGQDTALEMAERMIPELITGGNRGMVISSGSKILQSEFSEDPEELLALMQTVRSDPAQWGEPVYAQTEESRYEEVMDQPTIRLKRAAARAFELEERRITSNRLRRLSATLGGLAEVDPPKALFYFADAVRSQPGEHYLRPFMIPGPAGPFTEGSLAHHTFAFDEVLDAANAQGVRLYTIQAQGQQPIPRLRYGKRNDVGLARFLDAEKTMGAFAAETGGKMFFGGTHASVIDKIFQQLDQDLGCMYLLSFYPEDLPEDKTLRVLLRFNLDSDLARDTGRSFSIRARGQLVIQSESKREESLLLAAHIGAAGLDSGLGRGVAIPLGFENGAYLALAQFAIRDSHLPTGGGDQRQWDLGMTHLFERDVQDKVSIRVEHSDPSSTVVLEAEWSFRPGRSEIVSVGREQQLGQLATAQLELDWPDPDKNVATVTPVVVVQEIDGIFVRKSGVDDDDAQVRHRGPLGVGEEPAQVDRPLRLIELVCRGRRAHGELWIQRRLVGSATTEFELLRWEPRDERCIQVRDAVPEDRVGPGDHSYEVAVYDNPALRGQPIVRRTRDFTIRGGDSPAPDSSTPIDEVAVSRPPPPPVSTGETVSDFDLPGRRPQGPAADLDAGLSPLEVILENMARVAVLYADSALGFTADEITAVTTHDYLRGVRKKYLAPKSVYCYYDAGHGRLDDRRIAKAQLVRFRKKLERHEDITVDLTNAPDPLRNNTAVPSYVLRPYAWMHLFSHEAQARYRYQIEGSEKEGILLSFEPDVPDPSGVDWYGTVLVDSDTFQILRAEGQQHRNIEEHRRLMEMLESDDDLPLDDPDHTFVEIQVHTEFGHTAHGIRLPTKVESRIYHHVVTQPFDRKYSKKHLAFEVVQKYKRYQFYGVNAQEHPFFSSPEPGGR